MRIFGFNIFRGETKVSATQAIIHLSNGGSTEGISTKRNYSQFAEEGYRRNVVAFRSINVVARSLASIPLKVFSGKTELPDSHPLPKLLKRPNPQQGGASFFEASSAYFLISGNGYIEGVGPDNQPPRELWTLRPDRMKVIGGTLGVIGYVYEANGRRKTWEADPIEGKSAILHMRSFNPLDDFYGMSPIEAAAFSIDQHNAASKWNQSLLQNSARPSGAMVFSGKLADPQFDRLKEQINAQYSGTENAGRPLILEGGLDWKAMSLTPGEMDWINGKHVSAREIALAYGVPPQLLGIPGDSTYSNYKEARQALYEDTVIPLLDSFLDNLNSWLSPLYGDNVRITYDLENVPALSLRRGERWLAVQNASWMTINEKRKETGFGELDTPEANQVFIPSGLIPLEGSMDDPETIEEEEETPNG